MRRLVAAAATLSVLFAATAASAEGVNNLLAGFNGVLTAPLDPVWSAVDPPEATQEAIGKPVVPHVLGFGQGILMMAYRASMGVMDIVLFPFWFFPTLSPEARLDIVPYWMKYEVEYE